MTRAYSFVFVLTIFAISLSHEAIILSPTPMPTLSPEAAYALRSSYRGQPNSLTESGASISNLQLLSPIFVPDLINKKSKQRHGDRAMLYEPMLPLVEKDIVHLRPPPYTIGTPDVSEEKPALNLLIHYDDDEQSSDDEDSVDDDDVRQRKKHQRMSDESLESSSESNEQRPLPIKKTIFIPKPFAKFTKLQVLCPICVEELVNQKLGQHYPHKERIYEPMLPLVERESPILIDSPYSIAKHEYDDDSKERPKLNLLLQDDDDDDNDDSRLRKKYHRTSVESFESASHKSGYDTVKKYITIQQDENNTREISEKLMNVCAHFPLTGSRLKDDESRSKSLVVPGLMSMLCKMLLRETGYSRQ